MVVLGDWEVVWGRLSLKRMWNSSHMSSQVRGTLELTVRAGQRTFSIRIFFKPRKFALHVQMLGASPGTLLLVVQAGSACFLRGVESSLLCWETILGSSKWVCHFLPSTKDHTPGGRGMPALGDEPGNRMQGRNLGA